MYNLHDSTVITKVTWHMPHPSPAFFFFFYKKNKSKRLQACSHSFPILPPKVFPQKLILPPSTPPSFSLQWHRRRDPPFLSPFFFLNPIFSPHRHCRRRPPPLSSIISGRNPFSHKRQPIPPHKPSFLKPKMRG